MRSDEMIENTAYNGKASRAKCNTAQFCPDPYID